MLPPPGHKFVGAGQLTPSSFNIFWSSTIFLTSSSTIFCSSSSTISSTFNWSSSYTMFWTSSAIFCPHPLKTPRVRRALGFLVWFAFSIYSGLHPTFCSGPHPPPYPSPDPPLCSHPPPYSGPAPPPPTCSPPPPAPCSPPARHMQWAKARVSNLSGQEGALAFPMAQAYSR